MPVEAAAVSPGGWGRVLSEIGCKSEPFAGGSRLLPANVMHAATPAQPPPRAFLDFAPVG